MFEFEVDHGVGNRLPLPAEAQELFFRQDVKALALLPWEEHCTECAMPQCYATCDLYAARKDGKCRRFHHGFEYIPLPGSATEAIAGVSFKRWGTVLAYGNLQLVPRTRARRLTVWLDRLAHLIGRLPDGGISVAGRRALFSRFMRRLKRTVATSRMFRADGLREPTAFVMEIHNPNARTLDASLVIRDEGPLRVQPFQELVVLRPGFSRLAIPFHRISPHIDPARLFTLSLCPNLSGPEDEGVTLYFGMMSFVAGHAEEGDTLAHTYHEAPLPPGTKHVKAVAWDLDNTVWKGILLEDGEEGLSLRPQIVAVMKELDRRGIINSVVSKNDPDIVAPLLQRFGIAEYVVFPKIGWMPKSQSVLELVKSLNIGADTVVVVDDSPFEREEISARCTGVRVYPETAYLDLLAQPAFCPPLSAESGKRRAFYRAEEQRSAVATASAGSYTEFLRQCQMRMQVQPVDPANTDRVHELIQRTNQLNFSGNRYSREEVETFLARDELVPITISCRDRFGDYGLVGFCLYDRSSQGIRDLMFSCRVQAKTVEHVFLRRLGLSLKEQGIPQMKASYKRTAKNAQAAKVFDDLGFQLVADDESNASRLYVLDLARLVPQDEIIAVEWSVAP